MKKVSLLLLSLILLSGCSASPQEKRNKFDGCVIDQMAIHNVDGVNSAVVAGWQQEAEKACRNFLD
ncbi:MAG: hypothetical protein F2699_00910 [Actinobacteria bacterium]|uniref:Unannotated protein n=1 Tax=freshwater metagenome TaxID=449393 RepID=A0A6J6SMI6_9ZZZZ|nr:hypothetical protein [Actinomycetota bacterium]